MRFGYTIVFVEDPQATAAFYQRAFGVEIAVVNPMFAQMRTGEVTLAFGANVNERSELPIHFRENRPDLDPAGAQISFIAEDVPTAFAHAVEAGAIPVVQPTVMPWGQTVSRVRDNNGFLVSIVSTPPTFG